MYVPALHSVRQDAAVVDTSMLYLPRAQLVQLAEPFTEYVPPVHRTKFGVAVPKILVGEVVPAEVGRHEVGAFGSRY